MELDELLTCWRINQSKAIDLLGVCSDDTFALKPGAGKSIRSNFVHIVGVRVMWIEVKLPKEPLDIPKLDWKTADRNQIHEGLMLSSELVEKMFLKIGTNPKSKKGSLISLYSYLLAHEAHHRSQIEISLRIAGKEPSEKFLYDLWDWSGKGQ